MDDHYKKAIFKIKSVVDAYDNRSILITSGKDDFDVDNHIYDVSAVMGLIRNHVNEALRVSENKKKKGETGYEGIKSISEFRLGCIRCWKVLCRYWHG